VTKYAPVIGPVYPINYRLFPFWQVWPGNNPSKLVVEDLAAPRAEVSIMPSGLSLEARSALRAKS